MVTKLEELHIWPAWPRLRLLTGRGHEILVSKNRYLDLADTMMGFRDGQRTFLFGVRTLSRKWDRWTDQAMSNIEWRIKYDLSFDGYSANVTRVSGGGLDCTREAVWKVVARPRA